MQRSRVHLKCTLDETHERFRHITDMSSISYAQVLEKWQQQQLACRYWQQKSTLLYFSPTAVSLDRWQNIHTTTKYYWLQEHTAFDHYDTKLLACKTEAGTNSNRCFHSKSRWKNPHNLLGHSFFCGSFEVWHRSRLTWYEGEIMHTATKYILLEVVKYSNCIKLLTCID